MKYLKFIIKEALIACAFANIMTAIAAEIKLKKNEQLLEDRANDFLDNEVNCYEKRHIKVYSEELEGQREEIKKYLILSVISMAVSLMIPKD